MFFIFLLELEISGWAYREYIKTAKMTAYSENFLCCNGFDAVLAIFRSYRFDSKAVEKIDTDEKGYHKCSLCVIV